MCEDNKYESSEKCSINIGFVRVFNQLIKIIDKNLAGHSEFEHQIIMSKKKAHDYDHYIFNVSNTEPINPEDSHSYSLTSDVYSPGSIEKTILEKYSQILGYQIDLSSEFNEFKIKIPIVSDES